MTPLRADARAEAVGLDRSEHGEEAYADGEGAILLHDDPADVPAPGREPVLA